MQLPPEGMWPGTNGALDDDAFLTAGRRTSSGFAEPLGLPPSVACTGEHTEVGHGELGVSNHPP